MTENKNSETNYYEIILELNKYISRINNSKEISDVGDIILQLKAYIFSKQELKDIFIDKVNKAIVKRSEVLSNHKKQYYDRLKQFPQIKLEDSLLGMKVSLNEEETSNRNIYQTEIYDNPHIAYYPSIMFLNKKSEEINFTGLSPFQKAMLSNQKYLIPTSLNSLEEFYFNLETQANLNHIFGDTENCYDFLTLIFIDTIYNWCGNFTLYFIISAANGVINALKVRLAFLEKSLYKFDTNNKYIIKQAIEAELNSQKFMGLSLRDVATDIYKGMTVPDLCAKYKVDDENDMKNNIIRKINKIFKECGVVFEGDLRGIKLARNNLKEYFNDI